MQKSILSISPRSYRSVVSHWNDPDITIHDLINGDIITQTAFHSAKPYKMNIPASPQNTVWLYAGVVWILQIPLPCLSSQARRPDNSRGPLSRNDSWSSRLQRTQNWWWLRRRSRSDASWGSWSSPRCDCTTGRRPATIYRLGNRSNNQSIILFISQHNLGT